jgi:hypothetical protein
LIETNNQIFIINKNIMATLNFTVAYAETLSGLAGLEPSLTIYAEDLILCDSCINETESCYACLSLQQQVFYDEALTSPVVDGYYKTIYTDSMDATWYIVGGYPQSEGFYNPIPE